MAVFALLAVAAHAIGQGTVYYNNGTYVFRPVIDKSGAAWATFADTLNTTGWGVLNVVTSRYTAPPCPLSRPCSATTLLLAGG